MWTLKKIISIYMSMLCISFYGKALEHRTFRKEWKHQGHALFKYGRSIARDDNSFLYAICAEDKLPAEMNCNVTIETPIHPWEKNLTHKNTCGLRLIGSGEGRLRHEVTGIVSVERVADNRALVLWWERQRNSQYEIQNIKVSVLRMDNCTASHLTFPVDVEGHVLLSNVVVYPDAFDVVISHKATCGTMTCRISHDLDGRRIGGPRPFITKFAEIRTEPVNVNSSESGFYVSGSDMNAWKFRALHVTQDGIKTNLMTVSVSDPRQVYRATSNAYQLFGICLMGEKRIHCAQFDAKANVKMNASVSISGSVQWMAVHNLVDDGMLLLTGNCHNFKCRSIRVTRIFAGGRQQKPIDVPGLHLKCSNVPSQFSVDIMEKESDLCFYFACAHEQAVENKGVRSSVKFSAKCLPYSELNL